MNAKRAYRGLIWAFTGSLIWGLLFLFMFLWRDFSFERAAKQFLDTSDTANIDEITLLETSESKHTAIGNRPDVQYIGKLQIDRINLAMPLVEGVQPHDLRRAAGHVPNTEMPGQAGHCIIAGHRQYTYGRQFNRLGDVQPGDTIRITAEGGDYSYRVYETRVIAPDDPILYQMDGQSHKLTLITCTPIRTATHRLLVLAALQ